MTNCTISGSAFLGPTFTGVKTGSIYQSSLSYGSGKIIDNLKSNKLLAKMDFDKIYRKNSKIFFSTKDPLVLMSHKVEKIEYSEVLEPEPLP